MSFGCNNPTKIELRVRKPYECWWDLHKLAPQGKELLETRLLYFIITINNNRINRSVARAFSFAQEFRAQILHYILLLLLF